METAANRIHCVYTPGVNGYTGQSVDSRAGCTMKKKQPKPGVALNYLSLRWAHACKGSGAQGMGGHDQQGWQRGGSCVPGASPHLGLESCGELFRPGDSGSVAN